mmetsp:Transcript_27099/g.42388  ORF Transcript_27099/g.42388 Transcript_27099/m.42388 type:complete len:87 (+) Transcript_27099:196-456(+)
MLSVLFEKAARFQSLSGDMGGFAYDTCRAWGEPGLRWEGCDEFFPDPVVYEDHRKEVPRGCAHTVPQFKEGGYIGSYPFGFPDKYM